MKTQDGTPDVWRDNTFLAESGMLPKVSMYALLDVQHGVNAVSDAFNAAQRQPCVTCVQWK